MDLVNARIDLVCSITIIKLSLALPFVEVLYALSFAAGTKLVLPRLLVYPRTAVA